MPTIIAVGAHHDDVELRSGGTLANYVRKGWNVVYAVAATTPHYHPWPGEQESGVYQSNDSVIELRKKEARRGAALLGVSDVNFFDFKSQYWYEEGTHNRRYFDGRCSTAEEFRYLTEKLPGREFIVSAHRCPAALEFLCDFLLKKNADIVLTHFPDDAHWEHYATALLVCTAVRKLAASGRKIKLYAWEQGGMGGMTPSFAPTHFENISETIDIKCKALTSFISQFSDHDPKMFSDRARKKAKEYGTMAGMEYAEPFVQFQVPAVSHMEVSVSCRYNAEKAAHEL